MLMGRWSTGLLLALTLRLLTSAADPEALLIIAGDQHSAYDRTAQVVGAVDRLKAEHPGVPIAILLDGDTLEVDGEMPLKQTDIGLTPFSLFGGALKVEDGMKIRFHIIARASAQP